MASDPTSASNAWLAGMQGAASKITAGVNAVTVAPGQAAARQATVWAQNTAAAQSKYAKNVSAVSLNEWQTATINKGVSRVASGAAASQDKYTAAMTQILPQITSIVQSLPPRGTTDQNIQRAVTYMQKASQITYNK
jgi:hypothetical protein